MGTNQSRDASLDSFLDEWDGKEMDVDTEDVSVEVFDGKLTDTSFLPQRVHDECTNGYKWMAIVPTNGDDDGGKLVLHNAGANAGRESKVLSGNLLRIKSISIKYQIDRILESMNYLSALLFATNRFHNI